MKDALTVHHGYYLNLNIHFFTFTTETPTELTSVESLKSNITKQDKRELSGTWTEFERALGRQIYSLRIGPIQEKEVQTKSLHLLKRHSIELLRGKMVANKVNK